MKTHGAWSQHLRKRVQFDCTESETNQSMTKQSFLEESDVNNIVKKYASNPDQLYLDQLRAEGLYGDFSSAPSYQDALNLVIKAEEQFSALPASIRDRFKNDPTKLLEFVSDEKNYDEAQKLGLLKEKVAPPSPVRVIVENADTPPKNA